MAPLQCSWVSCLGYRWGPELTKLEIIFFCLQVLTEFQAQGANYKNLTDNELQALFEKKVKSNPKFKVHKDRVRLVK